MLLKRLLPQLDMHELLHLALQLATVVILLQGSAVSWRVAQQNLELVLILLQHKYKHDPTSGERRCSAVRIETDRTHQSSSANRRLQKPAANPTETWRLKPIYIFNPVSLSTVPPAAHKLTRLILINLGWVWTCCCGTDETNLSAGIQQQELPLKPMQTDRQHTHTHTHLN